MTFETLREELLTLRSASLDLLTWTAGLGGRIRVARERVRVALGLDEDVDETLSRFARVRNEGPTHEGVHGAPLAWPPPWEELDDGIAPVVRELVDAGFKTLASCDGHGRRWPQVSVHDQDAFTIHRLAAHLQDVGLSGCYVSRVWAVNASRIDEPFLMVEWWTDIPIKDWLRKEDRVPQM